LFYALDRCLQLCFGYCAVQVQQLISKTVEQLGGVDIMVANAGIVKTAPFLEMTEADFDAVLSVNLKVCQLKMLAWLLLLIAASRHNSEPACGW
jgi:glucose 1-dehydrogenase